ncbi:cytochrome c oxidase subunit II [Enterovirga rhinocerotis]|nr:cytochrome c oxidase subunit II [Enterovirga rhinocerotis]
MAIRLCAVGLVIWAGAAAAAGTGAPEPWQIAMQTPVTEVARDIHWFHTLLMWIITIITVFVAGLLGYCIWRFNEKTNPTPSKTSHNTTIEVLWTVVPVLILVMIAVPSFRLLRKQLIIPPADITIKTTGHSWYWEYEYAGDKDGKGGFKFDANLVEEKDLKPGQLRLLATDNDVVVPVNKIVRLQVTAADVIHAFAVPSFGIKIDAMPGRMNETWFKAEREGVYHGQCSELCGQRHAYMPITVKVVSEAAYAAWLAEAQKKFASTDAPAGASRLADAAVR